MVVKSFALARLPATIIKQNWNFKFVVLEAFMALANFELE